MAAGVPFVDGFRLWADEGLGRRYFLPQGADSHLDAAGYEVLGQATANAMMANSGIARRLSAVVGSDASSAVHEITAPALRP